MLLIPDMEKSPISLKEQMLARIESSATITVWTPSDFLDLGSRDVIDKTLQRLVRSDELRRIDWGLYDKPQTNSLTQQDNPPNPKAVIDAVVRRDQLRVLIDGMTAANDLGFTNAVPAKIIIHSEARSKKVSLGNLTIYFKQTAPSKLFWAGRPAMRIVQALHWLRDTMVGDDMPEWQNRLSILLKDPKHGAQLRADLTDGMSALPAWMQELLRPLVSNETPTT